MTVTRLFAEVGGMISDREWCRDASAPILLVERQTSFEWTPQRVWSRWNSGPVSGVIGVPTLTLSRHFFDVGADRAWDPAHPRRYTTL